MKTEVDFQDQNNSIFTFSAIKNLEFDTEELSTFKLFKFSTVNFDELSTFKFNKLNCRVC